MIVSSIKDYKQECGLAAAGAGLGMFIGKNIYKNIPSSMAKVVYQNGERKTVITNRFVDYTLKAYKKNLYSHIDSHTERAWLNRQISTMKQAAYEAKANPAKDGWRFQQIYDYGVDYLTGRRPVDKGNLGLAKRGANAIKYGNKVEKRFLMGGCAVLCAAVLVGLKVGISKFIDYKKSLEKEDKKV